MAAYNDNPKRFSFHFTLWVTKKIDSESLKTYKSILKSIDRVSHTLFMRMHRLKGHHNTLHGSFSSKDDGKYMEWYQWTAMKTLLQMTMIDDSLVVHFQNDYGCPLALELIRYIDICDETDRRVYVHKGQIHCIPVQIPNLYSLKYTYSKAFERYIPPREAAAYYIRDINRCDNLKEDHPYLRPRIKILFPIEKSLEQKLKDKLDTIYDDTQFYIPKYADLLNSRRPNEQTLMPPAAQGTIIEIMSKLINEKQWGHYSKSRRMPCLIPTEKKKISYRCQFNNPNHFRMILKTSRHGQK